MALRYYLVPSVGDGVSIISEGIVDAFRPKYVESLTGVVARYINYAHNGAFLVQADFTTTDHNFIAGQPDVIAFPVNLSGNPTAGQVTGAKAIMGSLLIPSEWVNTSLTYAQIVRGIYCIFLIMNRFHQFGVHKLPQGVAMSTQWNQLTNGQQNIFSQVADSFAFDKSGLSGTSTVGQILRSLAIQINQAIKFGGAQI